MKSFHIQLYVHGQFDLVGPISLDALPAINERIQVCNCNARVAAIDPGDGSNLPTVWAYSLDEAAA